jgi:hypothetical protein
MTLARAVFGVAGIPLLGGCMMAGAWGHAGGPAGPSSDEHMAARWTAAASQGAEATADGLTIVLSIPAPTAGRLVTIGAHLRSDDSDQAPADAEIRLRVVGPGGSADDLPMRRDRSSEAGTHQAQYRFSVPGRHVVTAEARSGAGEDVRTASVTADAEVAAAPVYRHHWSLPAAIIGSLAMVAMMAFMMAS